MRWNWQQPDWPAFTYDAKAMDTLEQRFLLRAGEFVGAYRHVSADERDSLRIELIGDEALKTSEIEGEFLSRDSVQASLRRQFGLGGDDIVIPPAERGISEMMVDLYRNFAEPLSHETLFSWHRMVVLPQLGISIIGGYREHAEAMQVVSGRIDKPTVHFEAPPSAVMPDEMDAFVRWFNETAPDGTRPLPSLTRAAIAHLYFVSIHPFEDGNGRIGRALSEKALAQHLGQPSLIALAYTIQRTRKRYYDMLERANKSNEIDEWLSYFGATVLEAQQTTIRRVDFYVAKARFYERLRDQLNERQQRVIARMFREGIDGFRGGLSAKNYITIADISPATATRDLQDLVAKGALIRSGELKYARYHLSLSEDQ